MNCFKFFGFFALAVSTFAANSSLLVSNNAFAVAPAEKGSVWVFSRGDSNGGLAKLTLNVTEGGVRATGSEQVVFENDEDRTAVHDGILSDLLAERRRTPFVEAGVKLGAVLPAFAPDSVGDIRKPTGFAYVHGSESGFYDFPDAVVNYSDTTFVPMDGAASGFALDSSANVLWVARGANGLLWLDVSKGLGSVKKANYVLNLKSLALDSLKSSGTYAKADYPQIFDVKIHPETKCLWLATSKGLLKETAAGSLKFALVDATKNARVTGVWIGGTPVQVIAETAVNNKGKIANRLWRSYKEGPFAEVAFRDTTGKVVADVYDKADYSVSNVAFIGDMAFVAVRVVGGAQSGLLKLDAKGAVPWENENQWLYAEDAGVVDRNVIILSVSEFTLANGAKGLAVPTYGNGISVSADSGKTWTPILNQASLGKNLSTVRMVPSVIGAGGESLVAYSVAKDSKITIEVFSYDMRKVRTIVKDAPRYASAGRSTNASEDVWDGRDDMGRAVTMGVYYVRVKDNHGHVGWGKAMSVGGK